VVVRRWRQLSSRRGRGTTAAATGGDGEGEGEPTPEQGSNTKQEELVTVLESRGMKPAAAKEVLRSWREVGIEDADDLRRILTRRSQTALAVLGGQAALDLLAGYISYTAGGAFSASGGLLGALALVSYGLAGYYALQALFTAVTFVSLAGSGAAYGADADAVMGAVTALAARGGQLDVVTKAKTAISMVKVVRSLNTANNLLKQQGGASTGTLEKLSAYLTLSNAEKSYGFDPSKYGLTEAEALDIAARFARYDANDDGRLELAEMERLFQATGLSVSEDETRAALDLLDKRGSGFVEFDEFVDWYVETVDIPEGEPAEEGDAKGQQ